MTSRQRLVMAGLTDTGQVRQANEDAIAWDEKLGLALLADGMGGHNAGDVASRMTLDLLMKTITKAIKGGNSDHGKLVEQAINNTNRKVHKRSQQDPQCANMGTTLVLTLFNGDQLTIAHVGDSRLYRLRGDKFEALTRDHSMVQQMIDDGSISEEEAATSQYKNVITRAIGYRDGVDSEVQQQRCAIGDIYLLCSDGLYSMVNHDAIQKILAESDKDWEHTSQTLVDLANQNGGRDNISVLIVEVCEL